MTAATRPGEWVDTAKGLAQIGSGAFNMRIPTDRYTSSRLRGARTASDLDAGLADRRPRRRTAEGRRLEGVSNLHDQSFLIVRGKDDMLRGFVNACRHRGNVLCIGGTGNAKRGFVCPYHLWSYDLEGELRGVLARDLVGQIDKRENSPAPGARRYVRRFHLPQPRPRRGAAARVPRRRRPTELIEAYHLDDMVTVLDVREAVDCNWKVVMDAFQEGYHIHGIHPAAARGDRASTRPRTGSSFFERSQSRRRTVRGSQRRTAPKKQVEGLLAAARNLPRP